MENEELNVIYDSKDDLEEHFKSVYTVVKDEYKSLCDLLKNKVLGGRAKFERKFENTEFDVKQGLKDLDIILQYSLVEIGFKKGEIRDEVLSTIEGVCEYGSLMYELREKDPFFNWTDFSSLDNEKCGAKLNSLRVYISKISRDFAKFFVFVNPSEEDINFAREVQQKINNILNVIDYQNMSLVGHEYKPECLANAIFKQLIR